MSQNSIPSTDKSTGSLWGWQITRRCIASPAKITSVHIWNLPHYGCFKYQIGSCQGTQASQSSQGYFHVPTGTVIKSKVSNVCNKRIPTQFNGSGVQINVWIKANDSNSRAEEGLLWKEPRWCLDGGIVKPKHLPWHILLCWSACFYLEIQAQCIFVSTSVYLRW